MKVSDMRDHLIALYPNSKTWGPRVRRMPDDQIVAIYKSKVEKGVEPGKSRKEKQDEIPF